MTYEAVIIDHESGCHKVGNGRTAVAAVNQAFRQILKSRAMRDEGITDEIIDQIGPEQILHSFLICSVSDDMLAEPATLREEFSEMRVLVRKDPSAEHVFCPTGWIRKKLT